MLKDNEIEIKWLNSNKKYYIEKGYKFTHIGDNFKINIKDLPRYSKYKVTVICDKCGINKSIQYNVYKKCNHHGLYYCKKCACKIFNSKKYNDNKNITEEEISGRNYPDYYDFIKKVMIRDEYTCQNCGKESKGDLNVHHLNGYNWDKIHRIDVKNGITLCENCHKNFHLKYGYGNNTKEQFEEWTGNCKIELKEFNGELPTCRKIYCIENEKVYKNVNEIIDDFGLNKNNANIIYKICNDKYKSYKTLNGMHFIWCDLKTDKYIEEVLNNTNKSCKKVICLNTGEIFNKIKDAVEDTKYNNVSDSSISQCCNGEYKTSGTLNNGERLVWMYYDDYINLSDKEIELYMNKTKHNGYRKVRCITTNEIFETIKEASIKYNIKASNIVMCCKGKYKYAGRLENGDKLFWEYIKN